MESLAQFSTTVLIAPLRPTDIFNRRRPSPPVLSEPTRRRAGFAGGSSRPRSQVVSASRRDSSVGSPKRIYNYVLEKLETHGFASISSSSSSGTSATIGSQQAPMPPPSSSIGSPLFWIGVGVGLSALFSMVAKRLKERAAQQLFQSVMSQQTFQNDQFSAAPFSPNSPFSFGAASPSFQTASSPTPITHRPTDASKPVVTLDVPSTEVETTLSGEVRDEAATADSNKFAFVDISPEDVPNKDAQYSRGPSNSQSAENNYSEKKVSLNGTAVNQDRAFNEQSKSRGQQSPLSVEALEKMMEDPNVQKMVYPYLPAEMRNPTSFKWMLQNPEYRKQLENMLNDMGGSSEWDGRMMESLKNFDLSSPEVKEQFDQIGLTPEEVISKIMANPEVAMAFQNPKVQAAIMDCSQNPLSIAKYQNDKEVMDVFNKISELFPGISP